MYELKKMETRQLILICYSIYKCISFISQICLQIRFGTYYEPYYEKSIFFWQKYNIPPHLEFPEQHQKYEI